MDSQWEVAFGSNKLSVARLVSLTDPSNVKQYCRLAGLIQMIEMPALEVNTDVLSRVHRPNRINSITPGIAVFEEVVLLFTD
jgi:hypothetical protein